MKVSVLIWELRTMFTRDSYLDFLNKAEKEALLVHRRYFSQFVTEEIREIVLSTFGLLTLKNAFARDFYFNSIHADKWHSLIITNRALVDNNLLKQAGETFCLSTATYIFKESARQIVE